MNGSFSAKIGANISKFMANMKRVQQQIHTSAKDVDITVDANTRPFDRAIARIRMKTAQLEADHVKITIEARIQKFQATISRIATNIRAFGELVEHTMMGLKTTLLPAIAPLISNIGVAIANLGPVIGVVFGQTLGLVGAFGTASIAAVAFGAVAIPIIARLFDEEAKLNAEQAKAKKSFDDLASTFRNIQTLVEQPVLEAFTNAVQTLNIVLYQLRPLINSTADAFNTLMSQLRQSIGTPEIQGFLDYLNKTGAEFFAIFGRSAGYLFKGLASLLTNIAPLSMFAAQGFENMSKSFADFTAGLSESKKFESFVAYTMENLPKVKSIFVDLFAGLTYFFAAFGTSSSGFLDVLVDMMARFKEFSSTLSENQGFQTFLGYVSQTAPHVLELISNLTGLLVNLGIGMAPVGFALIQLVNGFLSWFNELLESNRAIGIVLASVISFSGVLLAVVPNVIALSSLFSGLGTTLMIVLGKAIPFVIGLFTSFSATIAPIAASVLPTFGSALAFITGPIGIAVTLLAGLTIGAGLLAYKMSKSAIETEDWSSKVSESTAKAVGGFMELSDKATLSLNQLAWSGQTVTQEMADDLIGNYQEMGSKILSEMQTTHAAQLQSTTDFFANSKALTDAEEEEILRKLKENNLKKEEEQKLASSKIAQIIQNASDEKRSITEQEQEEINLLQKKTTENAVKYLTKNQAEQKVIFEAMKNDASAITAIQAAEVVKSSVKQKDEVIKEAKDQYKGTLAEIIKQRDETGIISEEQAKKLIEEAQKQRDETIKNAEDMHSKVVEEAKKQAGEHVNEVDFETGEVKSKFDVMKEDVSSKMREMSSNISDSWNTSWTDTKKYVSDLVSEAETKFEKMRSDIDEKMSKIRSLIETKWDEASSFLEGINLVKIGTEIINGLAKGITAGYELVKSAAEALANKLPEWMKKVLGIKSPSRVMADMAQWIPKGVAVGINNNLGPVKKASQAMAKAVHPDFSQTVKATDKLMNQAKRVASKSAKETQMEIKKIEEEYAQKRQELVKKSSNNIAETNAKARDKEQSLNASQQRAITNNRVKTNDQLIKLEKEKANKIAEVNGKSEKNRYDALKQYLDRNVQLEKFTTQEVASYWEYVTRTFKEGTDERIEAQIQFNKAISDLTKEQFDKEKSYVESMKRYKTLSLTQELKVYENYISKHKKGSEEQIYYQEKIEDTRVAIHERLLALNDEFTNKIKQSQQAEIDGIASIKDKYQQAEDARYNSYQTALGLFDEIQEKEAVVGDTLITNLHNQVVQMRTWADSLQSLANKGINQGLLAELQAAGPSAAKELSALNNLTEDQLNEYNKLWLQKSTIARNQAQVELKGLREDADKEIEELKKTTSTQLDQYKNEWIKQVKAIRNGTVGEFNPMVSSLSQIGMEAMRGLAKGMRDQTEEVRKAAKEVSDVIDKTIRKNLQIKSPSRVTAKDGMYAGQGLVEGLNNTKSEVAKATRGLTDMMQNDLSAASLGLETSLSGGVNSNLVNSYEMSSGNDQVGLLKQIAGLIGKLNLTVELDGDIISEKVDQNRGYNYSAMRNVRGY